MPNPRDDNRIPVLYAITDDGNSTVTALQVDTTTKRLKCTATLSTVTAAQGGTGQTSYTKGDILVASAATTLTKLAVGADGTQLQADSTQATGVKWTTSGTGDMLLGTAQTVTANKTFNDGTLILAGSVSGTTTLKATAAAGTTTITFPAATDTAVTLAATQTLTNKTLGNTNTLTVKDANFTLQDDVDTTKQLAFQLSGITTGTTRTITIPDASGTATLLGNASTGSGSVVLATSPTLVTPTLGVATVTSVNKMAITAPATSSTLAVADGKTLTASNTLTLAGTDSTTMTFPSTSATIARTDAGQTFTGVNTFTSPKIITDISDTNGNELIKFTATGSAVNEVTITNAATGTAGPTIAASGETNVDLKIAGKGTGKVHFTTGSYGDVTTDTDGATVTFSASASNIHQVTLAGNRTLALSNDSVGQCLIIDLIQDGTGSRTVTWWSGISWAGGSAPTLTTTAGKMDSIGIRVKTAGSAYYGYVVGANI